MSLLTNMCIMCKLSVTTCMLQLCYYINKYVSSGEGFCQCPLGHYSLDFINATCHPQYFSKYNITRISTSIDLILLHQLFSRTFNFKIRHENET